MIQIYQQIFSDCFFKAICKGCGSEKLLVINSEEQVKFIRRGVVCKTEYYAPGEKRKK